MPRAELIHALRERHPGLDAQLIDDIVLGCVSPVGEQGMGIARNAALKALLPQEVAGVQLHRFCVSGLEAVNQVVVRARSGWEDLLIGAVLNRCPGSPWAPMAAPGPWTRPPRCPPISFRRESAPI